MELASGFKLGEWSVFPLEGRLHNDGDSRRLPPKSMDVLVYLAERAPKVVGREALLDTIWDGRAQTDEPLTRCISDLRRELGDDRANPTYIETIPKRGYRLLVPPMALTAPTLEDPAGTETAVESTPKRRRISRDTLKNVGIAAALLLVAALAEVLIERAIETPETEPDAAPAAETETDRKVEELLALLRNQAAASGAELAIDSEVAVRRAIQAIVASGNLQKRNALQHLENGEVAAAAELMAKAASEQATAVSVTSDAAAESWREAGELFYAYDNEQAVRAFEEANRLEPGNPETLRRLADTLVRAGRQDEALQVYAETLAADPSPGFRASVHFGIGEIAMLRGDYPTAEQEFLLGLDIAEANEVQRKRGMAFINLAELSRRQGELDTAERQLRRAMDIAEQLGDESLLGKATMNQGLVAASGGSFDEAERLIQSAYEIYSSKDDMGRQVNALGNLGAVALARGDPDAAEPLLLQSVALSEQLGWKTSIASDLINLGNIAMDRRDFDAAQDYLDRAEALAIEAELSELLPIVVFNRGEAAMRQEDFETACRLWRQAEAEFIEMGSEHVALAKEHTGRPECAAF